MHRLDRLLHLLVYKHVVAREDTLPASALVATHPPILIHVLVNGDTVVLLEIQIPTISGGVAVQGAGVSNSGLDIAVREARRGCLVIRGWRGGMRLDLEILESSGRSCVGGGRRGRGRRGRSGLGGSGFLGGSGGACRSSERTREGGLRRESGVDSVVDGVVNHASLKEVLEFL